MWKTLRGSRLVQVALGYTLAAYLRAVWRSYRLILEPDNVYEIVDERMPFILTFWHGQHFLTPFVMKPHHRAKVMISRHADADINAIAAEALNVETIRGSGAHGRDFHRKGSVAATRQLIDALRNGVNVAMTADVPKISRRVGLGVIAIARYSGRPIYPIAIATRNRIVANSWDRASVHLPFGPAAMVVGWPTWVRADADNDRLEAARRELQEQLDWVTARAEWLVGRSSKGQADGR